MQDRLQHLVATIDQGIALKRRIIEDLRPSSLSNLGLRAALEILAGEFQQRSGITVRTEIADIELPDAACIAIYRLVQESLTNIAKHAGASAVDVRLLPQDKELLVQVQDNGHGFDPRAVKPGSHGLLGIQFRVEALSGTVRIVSAPGQGTRVEARLPAVLQAHAPVSDPAADASSGASVSRLPERGLGEHDAIPAQPAARLDARAASVSARVFHATAHR
jgi:signal transduction histidine kinase